MDAVPAHAGRDVSRHPPISDPTAGGESGATGEVIPRWEWRSFDRHFGAAESRPQALTVGAVQESDEIDLLHGTGDNVKVRDRLMDIEVLRKVNKDGLDQWTPVMKQSFPLPAEAVTKVHEALRRPVPSLSRPAYSLDELIADFAAPGSPIRAVLERKRQEGIGRVGEKPAPRSTLPRIRVLSTWLDGKPDQSAP